MNKITTLVAAALLAAVCTAPAQDWAKAKLDKSPRHGEWVKVKNGTREVQSFITYPEVKDKATAVVVIHEIFGLTDWARSVTDEFAEAGYIAISPDLLSGAGPKGGGTSELAETGGVGKAIQALPADQITADLNACVDYVKSLPSCNGKVVVIGFCWGGGQSFRFATNDKDLKAAFVCYGTGPTKDEDIARINCPVYGFYGGNDGRVTLTTEKTTELMKKAAKTYEPTVYDGAGHGFMRAGEDPGDKNPSNKTAHDAAWVRIKEILAKL
jgi:carboxymethylenebutenolidase